MKTKSTISFHNPAQKFDTMQRVHSVTIKEYDRSIDWTPMLYIVLVVVIAVFVIVLLG
jgi:hypothetical protein